MFSMALRLTYGSQSKTEVGLCVTSLGRESVVLELAGDTAAGLCKELWTCED